MTYQTHARRGAGLAWVVTFFSLGGCQTLFGIELPDPKPSGDEGAGGLGGAGGSAGVGTAGLGPAGRAGTGGANNGSGGSAGASGAGSAGSAGGPTCTAPQVACANACVDVSSNREHCGGCGYACGPGSTCEAGACAPQAIVTTVVAPFAFTLDATSLYFGSALDDTNNNPSLAVRKVSREGGSAISVVFPGAFFRSRTLVLADGNLFFGDLDTGGAIRKGPAAGGDDLTHVTGQPAIQHLVAADSRLWWSSFNGNSEVRRAPISASTPVESLAFQSGRVDSLAVEGSGNNAAVYWVNRDTSAGAKGGLWRRGGGAEVRLVPGGQMRQLAIGPDAIYVADVLTGIGKTAKAVAQDALSPVVVPGDTGGAPQGLALANGKLYWLAVSGEGKLELHRAELDGTGGRVLGRVAAKQPSYWEAPIGPSQLTVDGGFVYFADAGTVTGDTQAAPNLQGVKGAADGVIYRLPQ